MTKRDMRRRLLLPGVVPLLVAGASVVGPSQAAAASEPVREALVVGPGSGPVTTRSALQVGGRYQVRVQGTYEVDGTGADAECVRSSVLLWSRGGADRELLIDGADVEWQPADGGLTGCDANGHRYTFEGVVPSDGTLTFSLQLPEGATGLGQLDVLVEGPPAAEGSGSGSSSPRPPTPGAPGADEGAPGTDAGEPADPTGGEQPRDGGSGAPVAAPTGGRSPAGREHPPTDPTSGSGPGAVVAPASDAGLPGRPGSPAGGGTPGDGSRRLTPEELFDVLVPGPARGRGGDVPATHDIELAVRPEGAPGTSGTDPVGPIATGLVLVLLTALAGRGARPALDALTAELRGSWQVVVGRSRRRAVAHRPTPRS